MCFTSHGVRSFYAIPTCFLLNRLGSVQGGFCLAACCDLKISVDIAMFSTFDLVVGRIFGLKVLLTNILLIIFLKKYYLVI